jgi:hypothetical protein
VSDFAPRSGFEKVGGYVWLPRMLDKVRQVLAGSAGEYYALESSPIDQTALRGLRVTGDQVRGWVGEGLSDEAIAQRIREAGGVAPEAFNRMFLLTWAAPMMVFEADEGRLQGPGGAILKGITPFFLGVRRLLVAVGVTKEV